MSFRNVTGLILTIISLILLYPGLFEPMLTIKAGYENISR